MRYLLAVVILATSPTAAFAGDWEDALAAHDAGRYDEARRLLLPLAEAGSADAQNKLSHMNWYGEGAPPDYAEAERWSRLAAAQDSAAAHYDIGAHYRTGTGVPQSDTEAFEWQLRSAELGDPEGARNTALMYLGGRGIEQDYAQFQRWLQVAIDRAEPYSQFIQAQVGLELNSISGAEADRLLQSAAAGNLPEAQFLLGELFLEGESGWPRDSAQAHMWLTIAAASGCLEARSLVARLAGGMSAEQVAASAALVEVWQEANPIELGQVHPIKPVACRAAARVEG